jgi:acyl carrier protein
MQNKKELLLTMRKEFVYNPDAYSKLRDKIEQGVYEAIAKVADVSIDTLSDNTNVIQDLGVDSLDVVEIVMELEHSFDIRIPDKDVEGFPESKYTVEFFIKVVKKVLNQF